jgi:hypothetical protein
MVSETSEPFARIPIDICKFNNDCKAVGDTSDSHSNRIADAWEQQYSSGYLAVEQDTEGNGLTDAPGDGYSAHDEYRGFIVRDPNDVGGGAMLLRTNPVTDRNVMFFDDQSGLAPHVFGRMSGLTQPLSIKWHQIYMESLDFLTPDGIEGPVGPQNRFALASQPIRGYAVVILNRTLGFGEWGLAGGACMAPSALGYLRSVGQVINGSAPVRIDLSRIQADSSANGFELERARSYTVAHELGHMLGLVHSEAGYDFDSTAAIPAGKYYYAPTQRLYVWKHGYYWQSLSGRVHDIDSVDGFKPGRGAFQHAFPILQTGEFLLDEAPAMSAGPHLTFKKFLHESVSPAPNTSFRLWMEIRNGALMDWFFLPEFLDELQVDPSLQFTSNEKQRIRTVPVCPPNLPD